MTETQREFDIVVFGATGFTGAKTAEYLARHAPETLKWAIAGRNREKLDIAAARLLSLGGPCRDVGIIEASVENDESLARMAGRARVLVTTVGPFVDYGEPVVRACVEQRTDYIDSTGEPYFAQLVIARYAEEAARRGVRLVLSCGFDSIPTDLGVLFTVNHLPRNEAMRISGYVRLEGRFSGGTERSAIKALGPPSEPLAEVTPVATSGRRVRLGIAKVGRRPDLGGWTAPLPTIDGSVVLRSAARIERYGPDFSYEHNVVHASFLHLFAAFWVFGSLAFLARFQAFRDLLLKLVKKSGEGPTDEQMSRSWFTVRFFAECAGKILQTEVSGGDPAYGETSKMLAESALCLALDGEALPALSGVLTPAEAMGDALLERLQRAGLRFRVLAD